VLLNMVKWVLGHLWSAQDRYAAQAGLQLLLFLPQSPKCWDYKRAPPHLAQLGIFYVMYVYHNSKI
jgi:hypothetical protein